MSFSDPVYLYLLFLIIPFVFLLFYNFKKKRKLQRSFISDTAFKQIGVKSSNDIIVFKAILIVLSFVFFILALAGPQWGEKKEEISVKGIEVIFLLDTSRSMDAQDLNPNRLEVAKDLIINIVDNVKNKTDYFGLISFAGIAETEAALTDDQSFFKMRVNSIVISPDEVQGTDFFSAFRLAIDTLKMSKNKNHIIVLITDGEDQEKEWIKILPELKEEKITVFTIGVGKNTGAPIPKKDEDGNITGYKIDKKGEKIRTVLDELSLIKIKDETGGVYYRLTDISGIDQIVAGLDKFEGSILSKRVSVRKINRYQYPLFIAFFLLILEMLLSDRRLKWKKD